MKKLSKILLSLSIVLLTVFVAPVAIQEINYSYTVEASSVKISKTKKTLYVEDTYKLKIKGTSKKVKWSSSNKKVATVNSKGKVTAKKKGKATITAKVGKKKYKCNIKVKNNYVKAGKYKIKFGTYKSNLPKYDMCAGTYTINPNGTYSYKNTWKDYAGNKTTRKHSGKYKIKHETDDGYGNKIDVYVIVFYAKKSNDEYDQYYIKNGYSIDAYDVLKNNQFTARQYMNTFKLKK